MQNKLKLFILIFPFLLAVNVSAQQAVIKEEQQVFRTYPFGDPSPVVSLQGWMKRIYPYFKYSGYSYNGKDQAWKVVRLENPYIKVIVTPDIGGKVWGAVEKATNRAFIYYNNVIKFRDIAMRGPWTSGGIEFNFGTIGHTPTTSTPVDYVLKENDDGSVSCIVGALELASRTEWRVEIKLPKDKAYFETSCFWYNPTPLNTSLYHWMNASADGGDDLHFYFPGYRYISHGGVSHPWPIDEQGRNISIYGNNNFGRNKSYHILGEYSEYFGGNWQNDDFGFGHWSLFDEKPGKKIWIWTLSRQGMIWEDLLTDKDKGNEQYIEMQTGLLFNQAGATSSKTPFKHLFFAPNGAERSSEIWFPFKMIGGLADATPFGSLNVTREKDKLKIGVCPLQNINDDLVVTVAGEQVYTKHLALKPMQVFLDSVNLSKEGKIVVSVGEDKIKYSSADKEDKKINRPLVTNEDFDWTSAFGLYTTAVELARQRYYEQALDKYLECLKMNPNFSPALVGVAELYYRKMEYQKALKYASKALANDAYDPDANFIYGVINRQLGNLIDAKDGFSFAARSLGQRSAANTQLAEIYLYEQNLIKAEKYASLALDYNKYNLNDYKLLAIIYRKQNNKKKAGSVLNQLLELDPLNHFARFEQYLLEPNQKNLTAFTSKIRNELPQETYLELAIGYANLGLNDEAIQVLENASLNPIVYCWLSYLYDKENSKKKSQQYLTKALKMSPQLIYPFRRETVAVHNWANSQQPDWKSTYYLGLIYWGKGRIEEAKRLFQQCGDTPDFAPFYMTRANLFKNEYSEQVLSDYKKAIKLDKNSWRAYHLLTGYYSEIALYYKALDISQQAYKKFPDNFVLGMDYVKALLHNEKYKNCLAVLAQVKILPYEEAREGRDIYRQANLLYAVESMGKGQYQKAVKLVEKGREWPETLGVGRPYFPDERLENYVAAMCYEQMGNTDKVNELYDDIYNYTIDNWEKWGAGHYVSAIVLRKIGKTDKAKQLLENWKKAVPADDVVFLWSVAKFNHDNAGAEKALTSRKTDTQGTPWNPGGKDWDFPIILGVMRIIDTN
jgi:tetratricopeptide (TPR) repeat protein